MFWHKCFTISKFGCHLNRFSLNVSFIYLFARKLNKNTIYLCTIRPRYMNWIWNDYGVSSSIHFSWWLNSMQNFHSWSENIKEIYKSKSYVLIYSSPSRSTVKKLFFIIREQLIQNNIRFWFDGNESEWTYRCVGFTK